MGHFFVVQYISYEREINGKYFFTTKYDKHEHRHASCIFLAVIRVRFKKHSNENELANNVVYDVIISFILFD